MRRSRAWASASTLCLLVILSDCLHIPPAVINLSLLSSYDYIVVGGGPSGLTLANRLSENPDVTVLLLEAGKLETEGENVTIPARIGSDLGGDYDWKLQTVDQEHLAKQKVTINQGKVIGGGTVINGMVWTRGSANDYDAWDSLNSAEAESKLYRWRWSDLLPYFQKSENYSIGFQTSTSNLVNIKPDLNIHGDSGPVQVSYPRYFYQQSDNFLRGMQSMGLPVASEPNNGTGDGAFIAPSSISAHNQSRSDGRVAYLDQVIDRKNLHVATEQMVTRVLLEDYEVPPSSNQSSDGLQQAFGVEFAGSTQGPRTNITCTREVILAAGALFTPTLLQISGIGPQAVLEPLGITVKIDLPGVGANLQDHGMLHPKYLYENSSLSTASTFLATAESRDAVLEEYHTNHTGPLTVPLINAVAFPAMHQFADDWMELIQNISQHSIDESIPPDTDPAVQRGYTAQREQQLRLLRDPTEGAVEILADSVGTISVAMQRPLSRGTVRPLSSDIFDLPVVDPRYCADPFDCLVLARALLFNCALVRTPSMAELQPTVQEPYFCPEISGNISGIANLTGFDRNDTDARMLALARQNLATEFHPSGSTAMLPLDLGGVVDTELRVYGTSNLRVVDAGIMPMVLGAHLQAAVYGVAERAADIVKETSRSVVEVRSEGLRIESTWMRYVMLLLGVIWWQQG